MDNTAAFKDFTRVIEKLEYLVQSGTSFVFPFNKGEEGGEKNLTVCKLSSFLSFC